MTPKNKRLSGEYVTRIADLQYKRRENKDDFIILALLLTLFIEELTDRGSVNVLRYTVITYYPEFQKPEKMVKALDEALDGKGKFAEDIKTFKTKNEKLITSYKSIIPQKEPKVEIVEPLEEMKERTDLYEQNSAISFMANLTVLNKQYKTWVTQRDNKVRKTTFHNGIDGQTVGISSLFEFGGYSAMYPAHKILPQFDRLNCRCYLIYR